MPSFPRQDYHFVRFSEVYKNHPDMTQCSECGKMFKTRAGLLRHTRTHAHSGSYYCCGKAFQDAYHLRRHRASKHEGPKCHVCVKCGKSFADKYLLTAHEKSESKEGFVKCDQCGLEVRNANDLKEHVKTHMPDKHYRCEECLKTYKHKTNLSRHVRTAHTSVKSAHTS